ncbi:MAG: MATE family efflux transporter, partial [Christensenella sp.]
MEQTISNKRMMKVFLVIAVPVALQNLLTYAVGLMDSIMVGSLGEVQLSAVTVANQPFFLFMMCMFGLSSGACVLISQYWGKKDKET